MKRTIALVLVVLFATTAVASPGITVTTIVRGYAPPKDMAFALVYIETDGWWRYVDAYCDAQVPEGPQGHYFADWTSANKDPNYPDLTYTLLKWRVLVHAVPNTKMRFLVVYLENATSPEWDWAIVGVLDECARKAFAQYLKGEAGFETAFKQCIDSVEYDEVCYPYEGPKNPKGCFPLNRTKLKQVKIVDTNEGTEVFTPADTLDLSKVPYRDKLDEVGWRPEGFKPTYGWAVMAMHSSGVAIELQYPERVKEVFTYVRDEPVDVDYAMTNTSYTEIAEPITIDYALSLVSFLSITEPITIDYVSSLVSFIVAVAPIDIDYVLSLFGPMTSGETASVSYQQLTVPIRVEEVPVWASVAYHQLAVTIEEEVPARPPEEEEVPRGYVFIPRRVWETVKSYWWLFLVMALVVLAYWFWRRRIVIEIEVPELV